MSNIDKRALREAAEKAGADEWCAFIDTKSKTYSVHTPGDNRCGDVVKWAGFDGQKRAAAKAKFIAAANPATVLALLDELEALRLANAAQDDHINQQQDRIDLLEKGNNEAAKQINSWRRLAKQNIAEREKDVSELNIARKRIAELEASHSNLREAMAGIHNTITGGGAYTPLAAILNASKGAYEESAAAAGKGE
ncbi:ead/Ea22-like family protein [Enterobacter hormaechei]|uniref:ead/Ea22-like family protein n=1 Tax=Enterobacter hormaechei TaxID=158836 RepID=UPI0007DBFD83|nr:ead/Ea22-like family protein [Enterobacter hormaechei]